MRDSERSLTYGAEDQVASLLKRQGSIEMHGTNVAIPDERKFGDVEGVQRYVDTVLDYLGLDRDVKVRVRKGQKKAHYEYSAKTIAVPVGERWAMREMVILHEIAHHVTGVKVPAHGQEFRRNFCDLLERVLAPEARFLMQIAYMERGLKV